MKVPKKFLQSLVGTALISLSVSGIAQGMIQGPIVTQDPSAVPQGPPGGWANACYVPSAGGACPLANGVWIPTGRNCTCAEAPGILGTTQDVQFIR
jgi:hypothetical protein